MPETEKPSDKTWKMKLGAESSKSSAWLNFDQTTIPKINDATITQIAYLIKRLLFPSFKAFYRPFHYFNICSEAVRQEEAERRRKAAEELAARRARYDELSSAIVLQLQIISQNKGWFGAQAKTRKAAQKQLEILQVQLNNEFPDGKPW